MVLQQDAYQRDRVADKRRTKKEYAVSYLKFIEPSKHGAVEA
jgi:hypothetical protein